MNLSEFCSLLGFQRGGRMMTQGFVVEVFSVVQNKYWGLHCDIGHVQFQLNVQNIRDCIFL